MFDIDFVLNRLIGYVNSIIIDLSDVDNIMPAFNNNLDEVIKYIEKTRASAYGFDISAEEYLTNKSIFNRKRRMSNWRLVLDLKSKNNATSQFFLKLKQEDMENFINRKVSDKFTGFFLEFSDKETLRTYVQEKGPIFQSKKYLNKCYIEKYEPNEIDSSILCNEIYYNTSYLMHEGFYGN